MNNPDDIPSLHQDDESPPPQEYVIGVRYSLPAMLAEIRTERITGSFSTEKLEQKEIGKLFKPQKRRRALPKK